MVHLAPGPARELNQAFTFKLGFVNVRLIPAHARQSLTQKQLRLFIHFVAASSTSALPCHRDRSTPRVLYWTIRYRMLLAPEFLSFLTLSHLRTPYRYVLSTGRIVTGGFFSSRTSQHLIINILLMRSFTVQPQRSSSHRQRYVSYSLVFTLLLACKLDFVNAETSVGLAVLNQP
jgi:hypothetical protein